MVVISAAILSKETVLVSRQFVDISRAQIELLLSAFLRMVDSKGKDHSFLETDTARYIYLPVESLYLMLLTNKQSNILEDIETLKLMQRAVQYYCKPSLTMETVLKNAFTIIFTLDEMISSGYREVVDLNQIKVYLEMESHDEKLSLMLQEEKIKQERRRGQQIASRLEKERREKQKKKKATADSYRSLNTSTEHAPINTSSSIVVDGLSSIVTEDNPSHTHVEVAPGKGMKLSKKSLRPRAL